MWTDRGPAYIFQLQSYQLTHVTIHLNKHHHEQNTSSSEASPSGKAAWKRNQLPLYTKGTKESDLGKVEEKEKWKNHKVCVQGVYGG